VAQEVGDLFDGGTGALQTCCCGATKNMGIAEPIAQTAANKSTVHRVTDGWHAQRFVERGAVSYEQSAISPSLAAHDIGTEQWRHWSSAARATAARAGSWCC